MANSKNTIKTRIQLKNDTEVNWNKAVLPADNAQGTKETGTSFVPLEGEVIIYSADDTHPFSRLKIGDGVTDVASLPFVNAGSADRINHSLTFGNGTFVFDGSADVTVPVYTGANIG